MEKFGRAFLQGVLRLDSNIDWLLVKVTKLWNRLTGKSNFKLARLMLRFGRVALVIGSAYGAGVNRSVISSLLLVCSIFWWNQAKWLQETYDKFEVWVEAPTNTLPLTEREFDRYAINRLQYAVLIPWMVPGMFFLHLTSWALFTFMASTYVAAHAEFKSGKTVWRKAFEKAKATGSKIKEKVKDLIPEPVPSPIPALVGT